MLPDSIGLDSKALPARQWAGKLLVIELWASWCPFCKVQNPQLDALYRKHRAAGLEVLALSIDRKADDARRYMAEHRYSFTAAMFDDHWRRALGRPKGLPIVWVIGRDSKLLQVSIGEMFPEDLEALSQWL